MRNRIFPGAFTGVASVIFSRGQGSMLTKFPPPGNKPSSVSGPFLASDFLDFKGRTFTTNVLFAPFMDIPWSAEGIRNNEARHLFALNTCFGCHRDETGTGFLQIGFPAGHQLPATLADPAELAAFLTGGVVPDPVEPEILRSFNDLERRKMDPEELIESFGGDGSGPGPRHRHAPRFVH